MARATVVKMTDDGGDGRVKRGKGEGKGKGDGRGSFRLEAAPCSFASASVHSAHQAPNGLAEQAEDGAGGDCGGGYRSE